MDPQLKAQLEIFLASLISTTERGLTVAEAQIPQVIQEKLLYDSVEALMYTVLCVLLLIATGFLVRYAMFLYNTKPSDDVWMISTLVSIITAITGFGLTFNIFTLLKIYLAPRVYILEWLRSML